MPFASIGAMVTVPEFIRTITFAISAPARLASPPSNPPRKAVLRQCAIGLLACRPPTVRSALNRRRNSLARSTSSYEAGRTTSRWEIHKGPTGRSTGMSVSVDPTSPATRSAGVRGTRPDRAERLPGETAYLVKVRGKSCSGEPDAGNLHVRFGEGEVGRSLSPTSLLYRFRGFFVPPVG
jgi:hypothetical protein